MEWCWSLSELLAPCQTFSTTLDRFQPGAKGNLDEVGPQENEGAENPVLARFVQVCSRRATGTKAWLEGACLQNTGTGHTVSKLCREC